MKQLRSTPLKIGVIDDHQLFRESLSKLLESTLGYDVILKASNGKEFFSIHSPALNPELLLIDYDMPIMNGLETVIKIRKTFTTQPKIVAISMHTEADIVNDMMEAGCNAYITKDSAIEVLKLAINSAMKGQTFICPAASRSLLNRKKDSFFKDELTYLDRSIIELICLQRTNQEISQELKVKLNTISTYRTKLLEKLKVKNTAGLVISAIKEGIVKISDYK